jgi:DNA-binding response OmpR family regulator
MTGGVEAHLLVVDDNEMNRDVLARRLSRLGHQISMAFDGEEALSKIQAVSYDLVLLDIMMPKLSGYEVLEQIKADPATRDTPVIVISAIDELESVVRCIEAGAEDYLFKPFNPVLLKARVTATLEKRRLQRAVTSNMQVASAIVSELSASVDQLNQSALDAEQQAHVHSIQTSINELQTLFGFGGH